MKTFCLLFKSLASLALAAATFTALPNASAEPVAKSIPTKPAATFGPYQVITINPDIVRDIKVTENDRVYLLLNPEVKEKEIILKNSTSLKSGYRKWFNGEYELVSAANQGKAPNEFTDWVETTANYIEYYMDGGLILHLGKISALKDTK